MYPATVCSRNLYKARSSRFRGYSVKRLVRQQRTASRLRDEMLRHAAEYQFAESRMTIGARDNDAGTDVGSYPFQLNRRVAVLIHLGHIQPLRYHESILRRGIERQDEIDQSAFDHRKLPGAGATPSHDGEIRARRSLWSAGTCIPPLGEIVNPAP